MAALVLPAILVVALVCVYPLASALRLSFYDYDLSSVAPREWVGLGNYGDLFSSALGRTAIRNTLLFAVPAVSIQLVLGFGLALLLWRDSRFNRAVTALLLVPVAFTPLVAGLLFRSLYNTDYGPLGYLVRTSGIADVESLASDPRTAMPALILLDVWQWTPLVALILLAGLRALPQDVFEAAQLDGATGWQRLTRVAIPLMAPTIFLAAIVRTMDAFKVFDSIFVITGGGPGDATTTLNFLAYREGLRFFNVGYAAAISNVLLLIIGAFAAAYALLLHRYDPIGRGR
jgi:multiple sugar transport system permease protein